MEITMYVLFAAIAILIITAIVYVQNTYSKKYSPLIYDYLLHQAAHTNKIVVKKVEIPILKMKSGKSLSNHEASVAEFTLIKPK